MHDFILFIFIWLRLPLPISQLRWRHQSKVNQPKSGGFSVIKLQPFLMLTLKTYRVLSEFRMHKNLFNFSLLSSFEPSEVSDSIDNKVGLPKKILLHLCIFPFYTFMWQLIDRTFYIAKKAVEAKWLSHNSWITSF